MASSRDLKISINTKASRPQIYENSSPAADRDKDYNRKHRNLQQKYQHKNSNRQPLRLSRSRSGRLRSPEAKHRRYNEGRRQAARDSFSRQSSGRRYTKARQHPSSSPPRKRHENKHSKRQPPYERRERSYDQQSQRSPRNSYRGRRNQRRKPQAKYRSRSRSKHYKRSPSQKKHRSYSSSAGRYSRNKHPERYNQKNTTQRYGHNTSFKHYSDKHSPERPVSKQHPASRRHRSRSRRSDSRKASPKYRQSNPPHNKRRKRRSLLSRSSRDSRSYYSQSAYSSHKDSPSSNNKKSQSSSKSPDHYRFKQGEYLGRRYKVTRILGDGTFGRVVEAEHDRKIYAVKIIKPVPRYIESAKTEKNILRFINNKDPEDRQGIVRFVESFAHFNTYCLVFKPLGKSLYEVLKMNDYKGFPISMIQSFFRQTLKSIGFLHSIGYTHTDLKPQNILLEQNSFQTHPYMPGTANSTSKISLPKNTAIRIIDFGGATQQNEHHSRIINTRQYRSPQVLLQSCEWNHISDMWSIGCIIIELYTGDLYFQTHENLEHIRLMEIHNKGPLPEWMINRSAEFKGYFVKNRSGQVELDWPRVAENKKSIERVKKMLTVDQIFRNHSEIVDLLQKCLEVDPRKRIDAESALKHPFFDIQY